jgi:osmotically inducible protein OsmC
MFGRVAAMKKVTLPSDYSVDIHVNIGSAGAGYCLGARFTVRVPGLATEVVEELAQLTHQNCPYSKSVHGNIEVRTNIVTA